MSSGPRKRAPQFGGDGFTGHRARKRFGQNFLVDESVIGRIVDMAGDGFSHHAIASALNSDGVPGPRRPVACDHDRPLAPAPRTWARNDAHSAEQDLRRRPAALESPRLGINGNRTIFSAEAT